MLLTLSEFFLNKAALTCGEHVQSCVTSTGEELEQIQFLLGHTSVLTTERYLGCKHNLGEPVNARFGCLFYRTLDLR
jgi:hypothetical protein